MSTKITLSTISSSSGVSAFNSNFTIIADYIDNLLSLDGDSPNSMTADLDLNSNDLLNGGDATFGAVAVDSLTVDGVAITGSGSGSGIENVVEDLTPQLGGSLDVNTNSIVSTSNGDITLAPNGTGNVVLGNFTLDADQSVGAGQDDYVLTYDDASGTISLEASAGGGLSNIVEDTTPQLGGSLDVNSNKIVSVSNADIDIEPNGTGNVLLGNFEFNADQTVGSGQDNYVLTYDNGTGEISLEASGASIGDFFATTALSGSVPSTTLTWAEKSRQRPVEIAAANLLELDEDFIVDIGLTADSTGTVNLNFANSTFEIEQASGSPYCVVKFPTTLNSNHYAVEADVLSHSETGTYCIAIVGIALNRSNTAMVEFDIQTNDFRIVEVNGGSFNTVANVAETVNPPFKMAFSLHGNEAGGWIDRGNGWELLVSGSLSTASRDFTTTSTLNGYQPIVGISTNGAAADVVWKNLKAGPFGQSGLRDPNLVRYEDMTPVRKGSKIYLTMTASGPTDDASHWGVYTYDITTRLIEKVGQILFSESTKTLGRLPGEIVYDRNADEFKVLISNFGGDDSGPTVISKVQTTEWVLDGAHVIGDPVDLTLDLGTSGVGAYDPSFFWDGTKWLLAYTITEDLTFATDVYFTALASSTDFVTWSKVENDESNQGYEGTKITKISDIALVFAANRTSHRIYETGTLTLQGTNTTPLTVSSPVSPPHTLVVPINKGGVTQYDMIQFDGTKLGSDNFTWGTIRVHRASQVQTGDEHTPKQFVAYP